MVVILYCLGRNDKKKVPFLFSTEEVLFPEYFWSVVDWICGWSTHECGWPNALCGVLGRVNSCAGPLFSGLCGPRFKCPGGLCWRRLLWTPVTGGCVIHCSLLPDTKDSMPTVALDVCWWLACSVWWWHGKLSCVGLSCRAVTDQGRCHSDLEVLDASLWDWWRPRPDRMKVSMTSLPQIRLLISHRKPRYTCDPLSTSCRNLQFLHRLVI